MWSYVLVGIFSNKVTAAECSMWNVISAYHGCSLRVLVLLTPQVRHITELVEITTHILWTCSLKGLFSKLSTVLVLVGCPYCALSLV